MAVPVNPTVESIVTQALKRAGRTTPTATQIQEATDHALQEVKADIMLVAPTHPTLMSTSTTVTTKGLQRYALPSNSNIQLSISLLDGPDDWRGIAQAGTASTITLASTINVQANDIIGKYLILTSNPGVEQYRQILDFNTSTKVATVDSNWLSLPTSATQYLIIQTNKQLKLQDVRTGADTNLTPTDLGTPWQVSIFSQEFSLYPVPDKSSYGLVNQFYVDLSSLDETGDLFVQILREWRSLWIQGVAVKCMQRFDEDRYQNELGTYKFMLDTLTTQTCTVTTVRQED